MEMLQIIIVVSIVMWYIIDRFKPLWEDWQYGKYVTIAVSAAFAFALAFGYRLDLMTALGVVPTGGTVIESGMVGGAAIEGVAAISNAAGGSAAGNSVLGTVLTALTLMGGSSAVSELISRIKIN